MNKIKFFDKDSGEQRYPETTLDNVLGAENIVFAEEVLDEHNFEDIDKVTREELKKDLFIDLWNEACGTTGTYNKETGYFELNGITDLTYEDALYIYKASHIRGNYPNNFYKFLKVRTNLYRLNDGTAIGYDGTFHGCYRIEVAVANNAAIGNYCFSGCAYLKRVNDETGTIYNINSASTNRDDSVNPYYGCSSLEIVYGSIRGNLDINVRWSPKLTLENFRWWIDHAYNTSPITITVHPDIYAKLTSDSNTEWNNVLRDALEKQITFATI